MSLKIKFACCVMTLALALPGVVQAQDNFDGGGGNPGDWNDPLNWDNDTLPGGGNNVQIGNAVLSPATATVSGALTNPIVNDFRVAAGGAGGFAGTVNQSSGSVTGDRLGIRRT